MKYTAKEDCLYYIWANFRVNAPQQEQFNPESPKGRAEESTLRASQDYCRRFYLKQESPCSKPRWCLKETSLSPVSSPNLENPVLPGKGRTVDESCTSWSISQSKAYYKKGHSSISRSMRPVLQWALNRKDTQFILGREELQMITDTSWARTLWARSKFGLWYAAVGVVKMLHTDNKQQIRK